MHEVSITQGIMEIIERERRKHDFTRVVLIEITCGRYNCVSEESLQFCFETSARSTCMEGASLKINRVPQLHVCLDCRQKFASDADAGDVLCPQCASPRTVCEPNNDLYLSRLEVE